MNTTKSVFRSCAMIVFFAIAVLHCGYATDYVVSVKDSNIYLNDEAVKIIGLRGSNALLSEEETQELIDHLPIFKSYGVNTVSVYFMGSRFGDVKGYKPDASLDLVYTGRMSRILEAADREGMIVLIGCLYWGNSKAKENLVDWNQEDTNQAVANTVAWLKQNNYRNVIVDPDNEGMASRAKQWRIEPMIAAAKAVDDQFVMGYNNKPEPPSNADVLLHFSPKDGKRPYVESEGTPTNAPQGYWGRYSKEEGYYNYIRIGRYSEAMKENQIQLSRKNIEEHNGYLFASTWLQCGPGEGGGGPFMKPGGRAENPHIDEEVKTLQDDAGILWWLEWVKETYGEWKPPKKK